MNKSVFRILILVFLLIAATDSYAQRWFRTSSLEFGVIGGASHYSGDLTQQFFETQALNASFGLITRYTPGTKVTFRLSGMYGTLTGDDNWYAPETTSDAGEGEPENPRNLSFKSVLWDFTGAAEFNFRQLDYRADHGLIPYGMIGLSVFKFNPTAQFFYDPNSPHLGRVGSSYANLQDRDEDWVELHDLSTEGQETTEFNERKRYHLTQIAVPVGLGIRYKINHKWTIGAEYALRITFTDYLDDVSTTYVNPSRIESQFGAMAAAMADRSPNTLREEDDVRGQEGDNDLYGILGFSITYRIYGNKPKCYQF